MWLRRNAVKLTIGSGFGIAVLAVLAYWWPSDRRTLSALARNIYWEALAAKEPDTSARMVAYVTTLRAKANRSYWGGSDIYDVVFARNAKRNGGIVCQFSWTCGDAGTMEPGTSPLWDKAWRFAKDEMAGAFTPPPHLAQADHYLNIQASGRAHVCWFKTHLVHLGKADPESLHVFYRSPVTKAERQGLPKASEVEECRRKKRVSHKKKSAERPGNTPGRLYFPYLHHTFPPCAIPGGVILCSPC